MTPCPPSPLSLALFRTLRFCSAPTGQTFYYAKRRNEPHGGHLPVIESTWEDPIRFRQTIGPFIYAVVDCQDRVKYIGKSWEKYLHQRWLRPQPYIHHRESRDYILSELNVDRTPVHLWSATAAELKRKIPKHAALPDKAFIAALEALWLDRWLPSLWNNRAELLTPGFSDYEYWK